MKELRIPSWTGICTVEEKKILGLGNDLYQIGIAIADGVERNAAKVTFSEADATRKSQYDIDGIINLFPTLSDGVHLNDGEVTGVGTPSTIDEHWQMGNYSSSLLRDCLTTYLKPYITDSLHNDETYEDTLVIHLRGGDALDEEGQRLWRPSPLCYEFYKDAIERSEQTKILIVTTPPQNGVMHPLVNKIRDDYDAVIQHGTILEDFSVLINCTNLVLDFSTFGYTAALMNTNLKRVFISKFVDKKGISLLKDIKGDLGFTMPVIENCCVYVYDKPHFYVKGSSRSGRGVSSDQSQAERKPHQQNSVAESFGAPNPDEVSPSQITVIQGGLSGSGLGSYFFLEVVGMIEDLLKSDNRNFVVIPKTDRKSSYFPRPGTTEVNMWSTFFEPINPHLLSCLDHSELRYTDYNLDIHAQQGRIKAWPFSETLDCDLDSWFRNNRTRGHAVVSEYFVLQVELRDRVDALWQECFRNASPVLGLQLRGTDKLAAGGRRIVKPEEYFPYIESFLEKNPRGSIFVATDDAGFLASLKEAGFPFFSQAAFRATGAKGLFDLSYDKGPEEHGKEVIIDTYMLARCDFLIHGFSSVIEAVMYLNLDLHDRSVNLEYKKPQPAPWIPQQPRLRDTCRKKLRRFIQRLTVPYRGLFPSPPLFDRMPTYRTQGKRSLNFLSAQSRHRQVRSASAQSRPGRGCDTPDGVLRESDGQGEGQS